MKPGKKSIETFDMRFWRRMERISWIDGKNKEILEIVKEKRAFTKGVG